MNAQVKTTVTDFTGLQIQILSVAEAFQALLDGKNVYARCNFNSEGDEQFEPLSELLECKNMVQTQTFQKSEVYLDLDQINILLKQLFDLNDVKWCTTGARVNGVHLSKVQVVV